MAAITITSANTNKLGTGRCVVRTSAGIPYIILEDTTDGGIEVWKGDAIIPTSFTEQDSSNNPQSSGRYGCPACAIDATGIIHIIYGDDNGASPLYRYVTFNTSSNTFSGDVALTGDLGSDMTTINNFHCSISIDTNNIPHVAYVGYPKVGGSSYMTVYYNNRIGGAWNTSPGLQIEGGTASKQCKFSNITIDSDNKPCISYSNETDNDVTAAIGNANDASSFTLYDVDADHETTTGTNISSIVVDSSGNHYVAYRDESDTYIYINKHVKADAWTTWQTRQSNSNNGINPSLAVNSYGIYIFYEEDTAHDIVYNKYSGTWGSGSWLGETNLEVGTFNSVKTRWSYLNINDGFGVLRIDYVFVDETASPDVWFNIITIGSELTKDLSDSYSLAEAKTLSVELGKSETLSLVDANIKDITKALAHSLRFNVTSGIFLSYLVGNSDGTMSASATQFGFCINAVSSFNIVKVAVKLKKMGTSTGSVGCAVYNMTGTYGTNGIPTGSALATSETTLDISTLSDSEYTECEFIFSGDDSIELSGYYCIVFPFTVSVALSVYTDSDEGYEGNPFLYALGEYATLLGYDDWFKIYGSIPLSEILLSFDKANSDVLSLADVFDYDVVLGGLTLELSDSLTLSDSITKLLEAVQSDILGLSDSIVKDFSTDRSDAITIADSYANFLEKVNSDSLILSDLISKHPNLSAQDILSLVDELKKDLSTNRSDVVSLSDIFVNAVEKVASDNISLTDLFEALLSLLLELQDTINLSDERISAIDKLLEDTTALSDVISKEILVQKQDTISLLESLVKLVELNKSDSFLLEDLFEYILYVSGLDLELDLSDGISLSELLTKGIEKVLADNSLMTDEIAKSIETSKDDIVGFIDVFIKLVELIKSDSINIQDSGIVKHLNKSLSEQTSLADSLSKSINLPKSDNVLFSDAISKALYKTFSDNIGLSDLITKLIELVKSDSYTLSDFFDYVIGQVVEWELNLSDSFELVDSISKALLIFKSDAINVDDDIVKSISLLKNDSIYIDDIISKLIVLAPFIDIMELEDDIDLCKYIPEILYARSPILIQLDVDSEIQTEVTYESPIITKLDLISSLPITILFKSEILTDIQYTSKLK